MSAIAARTSDDLAGLDAPSRPAPGPSLRGSIGPDELAELVRSFTQVTERLQATHTALQSQVGQLKSELADANEQLRRSRELAALGEMAAGIAHEIRNPLGSIALDVEVLRDDVAERPEQRGMCERILRAVERLDQIVGDVLRFARDLRPQPVETDPSEVIERALQACEAATRRHGITVERQAVSEAPFVQDGHLVAQALTNLVRNAAEAMGESAAAERRLRIGARRSRRALPDGRRIDHLIYRVEDSGPGVPADLVERIFHPFFTTRQEGTGLGLAIVHRIVDAHGGSIAVENVVDPATRTVGGARFEIALPLKRTEAARRPQGHNGVEAGDALANAVRRRIGRLPLENAETG